MTDDDDSEIGLEDAILAALDARVASLWTVLPGKVVAYDAAAQLADIEIQVSDHGVTADGVIEPRKFPVLPRRPIQRLTGGEFFVGCPVAIGDYGTVVFPSLPLDRWLSTAQVTAPNDTRRHSLTSAFFVPGLAPHARKVAELEANADMVLGKRSGSQLRIKPSGGVELGTAPSDFVALASLVLRELQAIRTQFNDHTHATAGLGTPSAPVIPMVAPSSVAATQVKAK